MNPPVESSLGDEVAGAVVVTAAMLLFFTAPYWWPYLTAAGSHLPARGSRGGRPITQTARPACPLLPPGLRDQSHRQPAGMVPGESPGRGGATASLLKHPSAVSVAGPSRSIHNSELGTNTGGVSQQSPGQGKQHDCGALQVPGSR